MKNLFIAIASRQNIANLPPIIEMGGEGDAVLWLLSPEADKEGLHIGSNKVLSSRKFEILDPVKVEDINNPAAILAHRETIFRHGKSVEKVFVVLNGGQKLTPLPLVAMLRADGGIGDGTILYSEAQPAELRVIDPQSWCIEKRHYSKRIELNEILECAGRMIFKRKENARIFWPKPEKQPVHRWSYPDAPEEINELHRRHHIYGQRTRFELYAPKYWELETIFGGDAAAEWRRRVMEAVSDDLSNAAQPIYEATIELLACARFAPAWEDSFKQCFVKCINRISILRSSGDGDLATRIYYMFRKRIAAMAARRVAELGGSRPEIPLGPVFESAVEARVFKWLDETNGGGGVVTEAWAGVKVAKNETPGIVDAELDVVLILSNGILINLECKSFTADRKDLDARLTNLHSSSSLLARMAVVGPLYTKFADEDWFKGVDKFRCGLSHRFIPFNLPGQPITYLRQLRKGKEETVKVPPFEDSLNLLLKPYQPRDGG